MKFVCGTKIPGWVVSFHFPCCKAMKQKERPAYAGRPKPSFVWITTWSSAHSLYLRALLGRYAKSSTKFLENKKKTAVWRAFRSGKL